MVLLKTLGPMLTWVFLTFTASVCLPTLFLMKGESLFNCLLVMELGNLMVIFLVAAENSGPNNLLVLILTIFSASESVFLLTLFMALMRQYSKDHPFFIWNF